MQHESVSDITVSDPREGRLVIDCSTPTVNSTEKNENEKNAPDKETQSNSPEKEEKKPIPPKDQLEADLKLSPKSATTNVEQLETELLSPKSQSL